jgi:polar amino acid transport system substrate-binding protein
MVSRSRKPSRARPLKGCGLLDWSTKVTQKVKVAFAFRAGVRIRLAIAALALITTYGAAYAAATCEPEKIAQKYPALAGKKLVVEQDGQSPPFSYRDPDDPNKIIGFDADYVRAAMKCIGVDFEFKLGAWSGLLPALVAGQADVMWSNLYYSAERAKTVDFVTYMQAASAGLVAKGNPKHLASVDDFCGVRATAGVGTVEYGQLDELNKKCTAAAKPAIEIVTFPDAPAGARLVANDRADVLLGDLTLAGQFVSSFPDKLEIGFRIPSGFKIAVAVRKGNDQLLNALAEAITVLQADGTQANLQRTYHLDPSLFEPTAVKKQ